MWRPWCPLSRHPPPPQPPATATTTTTATPIPASTTTTTAATTTTASTTTASTTTTTATTATTTTIATATVRVRSTGSSCHWRFWSQSRCSTNAMVCRLPLTMPMGLPLVLRLRGHRRWVATTQCGWWCWKQRPHLCLICFTEKQGTAFSEFGSCGHAFCSECVAEMLKIHIVEGSVSSLRCPLPDCRGEVAPRVVRRLAAGEDYSRWRRLQVQKILGGLPSVVYCPRCEANGKETPILPDDEGGGEPEESPLAICDRPECGCSFCAACREAYHPGIQCIAQISRLEKLGRAVGALNEDKSRRQRLTDELQSLKLILAETVPCPTCKMPITRASGCNHMVCSNCTTHFCYRCGKDITKAGYGHFSAATCPTFDREEVERMRDGDGDGLGEEAIQNELEELRRQYPGQADMVWNFKPPAGAWRRLARQKQVADVACPCCGQWNPRAGTLNHIRCRICKSNFCAACKKVVRGTIAGHYRGQMACPQHTS
ncbi:unnamed protein product [Polarella glacialis]|uniref:RBR-type E3 ubiquitin transferase n=1 Tax=Polarella glacialis TaxID=89957 RepID=A0A813D0V9_POLGL|nr:unnamed protein product [Polarella glacialis]